MSIGLHTCCIRSQNESEQIVTPVRSQASTLYSTQTLRFWTGIPSWTTIRLSLAQHTKRYRCFWDTLYIYILTFRLWGEINYCYVLQVNFVTFVFVASCILFINWGRRVIGISGSLIWSKTLMELIFSPCGEFRWSPQGPLSSLLRWDPWDLFITFKICSDAKERVGCGKQREATAPI